MSAPIRTRRRVALAAGAATLLTAGLVTTFAVTSAEAAPVSEHHSASKADDHGRHGHGKDDTKADDHGRHGQGRDDTKADDHGRHGHGADDPKGDDRDGR